MRKEEASGFSCVLVGTYRTENADWIRREKLYNLPQSGGLRLFDALDGQDRRGLLFQAPAVLWRRVHPEHLRETEAVFQEVEVGICVQPRADGFLRDD